MRIATLVIVTSAVAAHAEPVRPRLIWSLARVGAGTLGTKVGMAGGGSAMELGLRRGDLSVGFEPGILFLMDGLDSHHERVVDASLTARVGQRIGRRGKADVWIAAGLGAHDVRVDDRWAWHPGADLALIGRICEPGICGFAQVRAFGTFMSEPMASAIARGEMPAPDRSTAFVGVTLELGYVYGR